MKVKEWKNSVCRACQPSLLPDHCHGHWFQLSINNNVIPPFCCLQLQDPVPLCCPHTLEIPYRQVDIRDISMWQDAAVSQFWQSFPILSIIECLEDQHMTFMSQKKSLYILISWGENLNSESNKAAGGVQIAAGLKSLTCLTNLKVNCLGEIGVGVNQCTVLLQLTKSASQAGRKGSVWEPFFPSVSVSCVKLTLGLSGWVIHLQVKRLCVGALDYCDVVSCPFVSFGQSVGPPVSPVDLASIHGDSKRVGQILMTPQHLNQSRAVIHSRVDSIRPGKAL